MGIDRRDLLKLSAGAAGATLFASACSPQDATESGPSEATSELQPMLDGIVPINDDERKERIEKARKLMADNRIDAVYIEGGSSMYYFTGVRWGLSERTFAVVIPARGEMGWVCPAFEEDRARELIRFGDDVRTWEEHESPYERIVQILKDRGISTGTIGMEERVRFFQFDGIRKAGSNLNFVSADPVVLECRLIKTPTELALMQRAADIDIVAYRALIPRITAGMTRHDIADTSRDIYRALGADAVINAQIDYASALPHGSVKVTKIKEGSTVLMDNRGMNVEGYCSDISRTIFYGEPSQKQKDVWNHMKSAQTAAFEAAKVGVACEEVDAAARRSLVANGYGPEYKLPGCPHRTGHGIGLDGHEGTLHLTKGTKRKLEVGMCFSNEPMIVIPGEFGVRLEDCMYMTEEGAKFFSDQQSSYDRPWG